MLVAELEVRHSRVVAPTRRVALGEFFLPVDPPGYGPLLLASVVGTFAPRLDPDTRDELDLLIDDLERRRRVAQPRLRHRFQTDKVGLGRSRHRLTAEDDRLDLTCDDADHPLPQILAATYAAAMLASHARPAAFRLLWQACRWDGGTTVALLEYLRRVDATTARVSRRGTSDLAWALSALGFGPSDEPDRHDIVRRFRDAVRDAHPDHGAANDAASLRITELTDARRILLGVAISA